MLGVDLSTLERPVWRRRLFSTVSVAMVIVMVSSHLYQMLFGHLSFTGGNWMHHISRSIFAFNVVLATPALVNAVAFQWHPLCRRIRAMDKVIVPNLKVFLLILLLDEGSIV